METRANYVAVGFFTLIVMIGAFAFIYWTSRFGDTANLVPINVRIEGAVTGLGPGSDVLFNGVKVGKVQAVNFDEKDPRVVNATAFVRKDTPLRADTRATLGIQGLTGLAYVSLKGGTVSSTKLLEIDDGKIPTIDADELVVSDILETVRDVATRINTVAGELEGFVHENREPITRSVANLETFSQSLSKNAEGVDQFLTSLSTAADSMTKFSEKLDGSIKGIEDIVKAVDPKEVKTTMENVSTFTSDLRDSGKQIASVVASVDVATKKIGLIVSSVDATGVSKGINDFSAAATDAKEAMADVKKATSGFKGSDEDIKKIISNTAQMAERLNKASVRVDGVLAKLESFLGSGDAGSITTEITRTLEEFRTVAKNLNSNVNNISKGLSRFSNRGLRDVETLVNESRRSIRKFENLVNGLEQNPQRVITGGDQVRQYKGRPKR